MLSEIESKTVLQSERRISKKENPDNVNFENLTSKNDSRVNFSKNGINEKVLELGPLESMFPCSRSKILDFLCIFDEYDYSISDISRYSGISFKTALNEVRILASEGIIIHTRTSGKALMYKLNPDSKQAKSINRLALDISFMRLKQN